MAAKKQLKKPAPLKVNKDAKPSEAEPRVVEDRVYRCPRCGHEYTKQVGIFLLLSPHCLRGTTVM